MKKLDDIIRDTKQEKMPRAQQQDLMKIVRMRAKVRREDIDKFAADALARVEAQLAAEYEKTHPAFVELTREAERKIKELDIEIAKRSKVLGIPEQFRPSLHISWYRRGENALNERRTELRRVAQREIEARVKHAKSTLLRAEVDLLTKLAAEGLTSERAQEILTALPEPEQLLPGLTMEDLEKKCPLNALPEDLSIQ
jgi:hypothetical protein